MKKTQQIVGLPVIEVASGNQLGSITGIVLNPDQRNIECLLIDRERWYGEMRCIRFASVLGIGEFAVTAMKKDDIYAVSAMSELISILEKNIQVINSGVMSRSGRYIGTVQEYTVDEKTGKIRGCHVFADGGGDFLIPDEKVITYGSKYVVIEDGHENYIVKEFSEKAAGGPSKSNTPQIPAEQPKSAAGSPSAKTKDPVEVFEARQRQYLVGKKATKKITGTGGQVIIEQGGIVTEAVIEKALAVDKYIELTMSVAE